MLVLNPSILLFLTPTYPTALLSWLQIEALLKVTSSTKLYFAIK